MGHAHISRSGARRSGSRPARAASKLKIGQPATFRGTQTVPRARLRITLVAYVDPVHSRLEQPRRGTRFVAFKLRIANLSKQRWQGTIASSATLVGPHGRRYDVTTSGTVQPGAVKLPSLNEGTTIERKRTVVGYLGWILPKKLELREFRYQLELGPDVAAWVLPGR